MGRMILGLAVICLGIPVMYQLAYDAQTSAQPRSLSVHIVREQSSHPPIQLVLKEYGIWKACRDSRSDCQTKAFAKFKHTWNRLSPDQQLVVYQSIHEPNLPNGIVRSAREQAVAFQSKRGFDQFQEFVDRSYHR